MAIAEVRKKMRLDRKREAIVQGEIQGQAVEVPEVDISSLSLPARIQYLPARGGSTELIVFGAIILFILELLFIIFAILPNSQYDLQVQMAIFIPLFAIAVFGGILLYRSTQRLEITDDGLTFRTIFGKRTIRWKEARLFVLHTRITSSSLNSGKVFELSSGKQIIHWTGLQGSSTFMVKTVTPFAEYERWMKALPALIEEKTGLKLYEITV